MSFTDLQDTKERVRDATDIVDIVGGYEQLRRQGRNYVALCPWHADTRPSLQVNPDRQSWKCWVCNDGGDVFSYVMKREGIEFREALELLADRAGISLGQSAASRAVPGSAADKKTLFQAMAWAEQQFHDCLVNDNIAEPARAYLEQRGITPASVERFHIGFAPNQWQWLFDRARNTTFSPEILQAVSLVRRSDSADRVYDFFRGRVMFSIRDTQHRPIAFGGRVLPEFADDAAGKYVNSQETKLFSKSNHLYGLDLARDGIDHHKEIVVVEGYTDVVMAHQFGLNNVVAVLGTALNERHIGLLKRYAERVTLVLDGDEAGRRRTNEILELFVAAQVDLRILTLPDGLDPCDFLLERGAPRMREALAAATDALQHKIRMATAGVDLAKDPHRANLALEDILGTMSKAPRPRSVTDAQLRLREQQLVSQLARQFRIPENDIQRRMDDLRSQPQRRASADAAPVRSRNKAPQVQDLTPHERELLEILVTHPELAEQAIAEIEIGYLKSQPARDIFYLIHSLVDDGMLPEFGRVLTAAEDAHLKNLLVELDERAHRKAAEAQIDAAIRLHGLAEDFQNEIAAKDRHHQLAAMEERRLNADEELAALQALINQKRKGFEVSNEHPGESSPTDGQDA